MSATLQLTDPPAANAQRNGNHAVAFNIEIAGLLMLPPATETFQNMVRSCMIRALSKPGLLVDGESHVDNSRPRCTALVLAGANTVNGLFVVNDTRRALALVELELKQLSLLKDAEIGWLSPGDGVWHRHYPTSVETPFVVKLFDVGTGRIVNQKLVQILLWVMSYGTAAATPPGPNAPQPIHPPWLTTPPQP